MDAGCLLVAQGEELTDEDYRVFLSDGPALGQVWVLGCGDPDAEGKTCAFGPLRQKPSETASFNVGRRRWSPEPERVREGPSAPPVWLGGG